MIFFQVCCRYKSRPNIQVLQGLRSISIDYGKYPPENIQVLRNLGFSEKEFKKVLMKERKVHELHLEKVVDTIKELGYTDEEIRIQPKVLLVHQFSVDHRFKTLEEGGISRGKITLKHIKNYIKFTKTSIECLKRQNLIPKWLDVTTNILSYSDLPPDRYPPATEDSEYFENAQTTAIKTYLSWKFGLTMEEVESKYKSYDALHHISIRLLMQSYNVLTDKFGLSEGKVKQNIYLFYGHPKNFLEILECIPSVAETPIQKLTKLYPKVLMRPVHKMLRVLEVLKEYDVPEEGVVMYPRILTLSPTTVRERLEGFYSNPVFRPFFCSPNLCTAVERYKTSMPRARLLAGLKWRCLSILILTTMDLTFQRRVKLGNDTQRTSDTRYYIKKHLGLEHKEIKKKLRQHPMYGFVPLITISSTLEFLLSTGFEKSHISDALPIVLYPKEKVAKCLEQVSKLPEVECCRNEEGQLRPELTLHLLLYYMEKPYQFSWQGIWSEDDINHTSWLQ